MASSAKNLVCSSTLTKTFVSESNSLYPLTVIGVDTTTVFVSLLELAILDWVVRVVYGYW